MRCDHDRLGQALDNLISNAITYSPDGGKITVRLVSGEEAVAIHVQDEGIGIPLEEQELVFKRFFRASTAAERHIAGVGLGLLIVKRIVEGHGGVISLSSEPGQGTTFRLDLPVSGADTARLEP